MTDLTDEQRFTTIKDRLIAATGSPGLTSFHDGRVHMTLDEWDRLTTQIEITNAAVPAALNRAADETTALDPDNEQLRDAANLMVNAALHFMDHPQDTLTQAVEASYDEAADEVLSWISGN